MWARRVVPGRPSSYSLPVDKCYNSTKFNAFVEDHVIRPKRKSCCFKWVENTWEKKKRLCTNIFFFFCNVFNPLPNDRISDWSQLKAIADNNLKVAKMMMYVLDRVENIVEKGENAGNQHFLLFMPRYREIGGHIIPSSVCPSICLSAQT